MKKEQEKEIFNLNENHMSIEDKITAKMEHVNHDGIQLYACTMSTTDKGYDSNIRSFMENKYKLSSYELNNYLVDDLNDGKGDAWSIFTKEYSEMRPEHKIHFQPTLQVVGDYLKSSPTNSNFKKNQKVAYKKYETIMVNDKASDDSVGFWGGVTGIVGGAATALGATNAATYGAVAAGGGIGGLAMAAGAMAVGHYGGKMYYKDQVDRNERYIKDQQDRVRELREKQKRNKELGEKLKGRARFI